MSFRCHESGVFNFRSHILAGAFAAVVAVWAPAASAVSSAQDGESPESPDAPVQIETPESEPAATPPPGLATPRATATTFVEAMLEEDLERATACLDLPRGTSDAADAVADKLFRILRAVEIDSFANVPELPDAGDGDSLVLFPRPSVHNWILPHARPIGQIELSRQPDGRWLFSRETCEHVHELYDSLKPIIESDDRPWTVSMWIESGLPVSLTDPANKVLGLKPWQWIGLLLLILLGVALDYITRAILSLVSRVIIRRQGGEARDATIKKTVRPFGLFVASIFWVFAIRVLDLPLTTLTFLLPTVKLFAMAASVWAAYRLTDLLSEVLASKASHTSTKIDDVLVPMVRKSVKIFITAIGIIFIADSLDVEILPLLTGLGIGSLAFAFAAKDTIENFFGSVSVIADRPFEVGDWVQIGDVEGTVEELGFRSTRVRTFYNSLMTVPNATLVRATVDNYGRRKYRRWKTHLNITYDTPPDTIERFCEGIRELIRLHPYTRKDYFQVWFHQFGPHSLDILVYVFHEAPDWQTELRERQRLMLDIMRLAKRLGVEFAFPTQTLHLSRDEPPQPEQQSDEAAHGDPTGQWQREGKLEARKLTETFAWRREKPEPYRITYRDPADGDDATEEETQIESKVGGDA